MKTYITQTEALKRYPITEAELTDLINTGQLDIVDLVDNGDKRTIIYDDSLAAYIAERDITPEKFDHLRGNLLGIGEAAREYQINSTTISRWVAQGQLKVKGQEGQKKLVDQADVAYLAVMGRAKKMRPGKKVFS